MANGPPSPDIGPPPSTGGSEGSPQGGPEAQSIIRPVQPQESAADVAGKAEAARAQDIQRKEGPGEALREVASGQTQGSKPEDTIMMGGSDTDVNNTTDSFDSRNITNTSGEDNLTQEGIDEIAKKLNEPDADRIEILGSLPESQAQAVANRARELGHGTQEAGEPENPFKELKTDQLRAQQIALNASKKICEEELEGELSHWQRGSVQDELSKVQEELDRVQAEITARGIEEAAPEAETPSEAERAPEAGTAPTEAATETPRAQTTAEGGGARAGEPPAPEAVTPAPKPGEGRAEDADADDTGKDSEGRPGMSPAEEELARLEELYDGMKPERLEKELAKLERNQATWERRSERANDSETIKWAEGNLAFAEAKVELAKDALRAKGIEPKSIGSVKATDEERLQAMEEEAERAAEIRTLSLEDLKIRRGKLETQKQYLTGRKKDAKDPKDKAAADEALKKVDAELKEAKRVEDEKTPEEEKKKAEAEAKKTAEKLQELQGKVGPVEEIKGIVDALQKEFNGLKAQIKKNAEALKKAGDDEARAKLNLEREELERRAVEIGDRLTSERGAFDEARKREREEFTLEGRMGQDTLREMSRQDYLKLVFENPEEAAKYLNEVISSVGNAGDSRIERIRQALNAGRPLSIEERAQFADAFAHDIIQGKGRATGDLETMQYLNHRYPDMYAYVMDKVTSDNKAIDKIKEAMPSGWEKALRFAKNNPAWLMIILAILAGTAGAVAVATGPGLGVAAGLGGAGAAGVGGHSAWRRR